MNKSNLMSKLVLGALVFSMATSQVSAAETAGTSVLELVPDLNIPDAPATVGRLDSLKAFFGNAWGATKTYSGKAWDKVPTLESVRASLPNRPTMKSVREAMPTVESMKARLPEPTLKNAGKGAAVVAGVTVVGLGGRYAWKRYKKAAPKVEVPVKAEAPAEEPAVIAVAPKVDTTKIDCPAFVKALENAVTKKNVSWRCQFVNGQLTTLGDASVTTLVTELRTLIKENATETEITTKLGEVKAKLA